MIIDSHVHIWAMEPERYPWQPVGGYVPDEPASASMLLATMDAAGVERAVLVQPTPYGWDNSYLLDSAREQPDRLRVVGLVDPFSPGAPEALIELAGRQGLRGIRLNWNLQPLESWEASLVQWEIWNVCQRLALPVCIQMTPDYMDLAEMVAGGHPGVRIVFDHLARPHMPPAPKSQEFRRFLDLARYSNCYAKLSGLYYYSAEPSPYADTWPLLQATVQAFGPSRCMWGSDFPFVLKRWNYGQALEVVQSRLELTEFDLRWILSLTAESLWWS